MPDSQFSDADIANILTQEDLRQRSQALDEAQTTYEKIAYISVPKMPCPECGGQGSVDGGSLSNICLGCDGARVVERPDAEPFEMPPFKQLRASISAYGDALADRDIPAQLGDGRPHPGKRNLALPAASTVPSLESLQQLKNDGLTKARQLKEGAAALEREMRQLPAPQSAKGLRGEGDLGEYEDAELADMEDAAQKPGGRS